ncbi:hypothetical protein [Pelovirga terrestris]|uniref:Uncharacterized protein n=1 Tax=Pelovirga terrestris TaxID=2771352 RepID=A0A8J6QN33_9BACT|nr:hypothetical protein [Pelovirga terrestris]MBD1399983.1 hypothetical protein [Pelovirga terrestris]
MDLQNSGAGKKTIIQEKEHGAFLLYRQIGKITDAGIAIQGNILSIKRVLKALEQLGITEIKNGRVNRSIIGANQPNRD